MKTLRCLAFALSILPAFLVAQEAKHMGFTLPLPDTFIQSADRHRARTGEDLESYFKSAGIRIPQGGRISVNRKNGALDVTLPQEEALKVLRIVSWCAENSSERAFMGTIQEATPEEAARDTNARIPIPQAYANDQGDISIHVEKRDGRSVTCIIANNSDRPTWFVGESLKSPIHRMQMLSDAGWTEHKVTVMCGTGMRTPMLPPGSACRFVRNLPETTKPVRIGVALLDDISIQKDENTVWTEAIKPPGSE